MRAIVLGAAAGGGFPQWNSNAEACRRARSGDPSVRPRSQASLAVSTDEASWLLFNASPDLRAQIAATPALHPRFGLRSTPIAAIILTSGEVDAIAGLLNLRERQPFALFATARILAVLEANPVFEVLARDIVQRHAVTLDEAFEPLPGLRVTLFAVPGKVPLYLEGAGETDDGDVVGAAVEHGGRTLFYVPGCAAMTTALSDRLHGADTVLFDGTLWADDEMIRAGLGQKTGQRMGHMSVSGPGGVMQAFAGLGVRQKILVHINNSNPVLVDGSPEHDSALAAGWAVAHDGMEIVL